MKLDALPNHKVPAGIGWACKDPAEVKLHSSPSKASIDLHHFPRKVCLKKKVKSFIREIDENASGQNCWLVEIDEKKRKAPSLKIGKKKK
jgi:hypothetical protein